MDTLEREMRGPVRLRWTLAGMAGLFVAFQLVLMAIGVRFETYPLYAFLHFIDPELLKTRLFESCFYLHIQPPLFNLLCGVVLKLFPNASDAAFHVLYLGFGLGLYLSVFLLLVRMGIRRGGAFFWSTLFMASPAFILYENWLFYTLPCALLLTASAVSLDKMMNTGSRWAMVGFFGALFLLEGIRSSYHFSYYQVLLAAALVLCAGVRKRVLVIGVIFLALILAFSVKNYVLFGFFGTSSLLGKNFYINTVGNMRWTDRERLVREGKLSELSLYNRWNTLDVFPEKYRHADGFESVPVLRQESKSHGPHNFNHLAHIAISNQYMKDAMAGLRESPKSFLLATGFAAYTYFQPSSDYTCSDVNTERIRLWKTFCDYAFCGRVPVDLSARLHLARVADLPPHVFLLIGLPLLFVCGLYGAVRGRIGRHSLTRAQRVLLGYFCFNIFYVATIGIILDFSETNRYRFETNPFDLCILALLAQNVFDALCWRRNQHT